MTPMAYAWTLFSGASIIKRRLTWTNDDPFAGSEVYGDVYQVVGVPLYTDDELKARAEAAEKEAKRWKDVAKNLASSAETDRDAAIFDKAVAGGKVKLAEARAEAAEKRVTEMEEQASYLGGLHREEWQSQVDRAEAAEKRATALREALKPFANDVERLRNYPDDYPYSLPITPITVGHFRRALAALEAKP